MKPPVYSGFVYSGFVYAAFAVATACVSGCGFGSGRVTRLAGNQVLSDRWIAPNAYTAYSQAAYLEAHRQPEAALDQYRIAAQEDPQSVEIWTRIGSLECTHQHRSVTTAFARAERLNPTYAPLWEARAQCLLGRSQLDAALDAAIRAVELAPDDPEMTLLLARIHVERGDAGEARRWLRALGLRDPSAVAAWRLLAHIAESNGDAAQARSARLVEAEWTAARQDALRRLPRSALPGDLDRALLDGDLPRARSVAVQEAVAPGELALRAVALGLLSLAAEQAQLVLSANPEDTNARVAAMLVAARRQDGAALAQHAREASRHATERPSELAAAFLTRLLAERVGKSESRAFEAAYRAPLPAL